MLSRLDAPLEGQVGHQVVGVDAQAPVRAQRFDHTDSGPGVVALKKTDVVEATAAIRFAHLAAGLWVVAGRDASKRGGVSAADVDVASRGEATGTGLGLVAVDGPGRLPGLVDGGAGVEELRGEDIQVLEKVHTLVELLLGHQRIYTRSQSARRAVRIRRT